LPGTKFYETVKAELLEKKNWVDSDDLALMFRGTYSAAYYRKLHRYVHKLFRFWKGLSVIGELIALKTSFSTKKLKAAISVGYFAPAALLDRCMLFYLVRR
jgi:anaerobic magnesium-protoporphyrin IX monomethyl ester cyclase